jgi:WLM domain.
MTYVKSDIDGNYYLVRNEKDKQQAGNTLARIRNNIIKLSDHLYNNIDHIDNNKYAQYIKILHDNVKDIVIVESTQDSIYTSYSINKGEQIVFCLRSRKLPNDLHDINLMMYVVLHEISHVACPVYDNHGPLFREIFAFICKAGIKIGIYKKIDFATTPINYCGLMINDSII